MLASPLPMNPGVIPSNPPLVSRPPSVPGGRKRAVLIGINYVGTEYAMKSCFNDIMGTRTLLLERYKFKEEHMLVLTDVGAAWRTPTRRNILHALHWLTHDTQAGDSLFLHYSGHGGALRNAGEEVLVPADVETAGVITQPELTRTLVDALPPGARLTAVLDSCHAGPVLALPYVFHTHDHGTIQAHVRACAAPAPTQPPSQTRAPATFPRRLSQALLGRLRRASGAFGSAASPPPAPARGQVFLFTGGHAAGADSGGMLDDTDPGGAMSWTLAMVLKSQACTTYGDLLRASHGIMRSAFHQIPLLSTLHPLDLHEVFAI